MISVFKEFTARGATLQYDGLEHGAASVHPGGHPGWSRADDDDVVIESVSHDGQKLRADMQDIKGAVTV